MYRVLYKFADLEDNNYIYHEGDKYPHDGFTPTEERIKELSGKDNKLGKELIIEVEPKEEPESEPKEENVNEVTAKEEKAVKTAKNVSKKQKKKVGD